MCALRMWDARAACAALEAGVAGVVYLNMARSSSLDAQPTRTRGPLRMQQTGRSWLLGSYITGRSGSYKVMRSRKSDASALIGLPCSPVADRLTGSL